MVLNPLVTTLLDIFLLCQLYKIMKEHKNPKVLSEGLSWLVSAVEDFGISHVKLKVRQALIHKFITSDFIFFRLCTRHV